MKNLYWVIFILAFCVLFVCIRVIEADDSSDQHRDAYPVNLRLDFDPRDCATGTPTPLSYWKYNRNPFSRPPNDIYSLAIRWESSDSGWLEWIQLQISDNYAFEDCLSAVFTPESTPTPPPTPETPVPFNYHGKFEIDKDTWENMYEDKTRYYYRLRFKVNNSWGDWTTDVYNEYIGESTPPPNRADWFYIDPGFTGFSYENTSVGRSFDTMNHHPLGETDGGRVVRDHKETVWIVIEYPSDPMPYYPTQSPHPNLFESNIGLLRGVVNTKDGSINWDLPLGSGRPGVPMAFV
ncbi:hypothetical protein K8T06_01745 [bacterium]|nr:hypothetical protein [bacterium]